jgi:hypothetical protein
VQQLLVVVVVVVVVSSCRRVVVVGLFHLSLHPPSLPSSHHDITCVTCKGCKFRSSPLSASSHKHQDASLKRQVAHGTSPPHDVRLCLHVNTSPPTLCQGRPCEICTAHSSRSTLQARADSRSCRSDCARGARYFLSFLLRRPESATSTTSNSPPRFPWNKFGDCSGLPSPAPSALPLVSRRRNAHGKILHSPPARLLPFRPRTHKRHPPSKARVRTMSGCPRWGHALLPAHGHGGAMSPLAATTPPARYALRLALPKHSLVVVIYHGWLRQPNPQSPAHLPIHPSTHLPTTPLRLHTRLISHLPSASATFVMPVRPPMATVRCFTEPPALRKFCKLVPSTQLRDTMAPRPPSLSTGTLAEPCRLLARLFRIKDSVCLLRLTKPHAVSQASLGPRMPVRRTQRPDLWRNMIQDCRRRDDIKLPLQTAKISLNQPSHCVIPLATMSLSYITYLLCCRVQGLDALVS